MVLPSNSQNNAPMDYFIIAPRDICENCYSPSGPTFALTNLRGPSVIHRASVIPTAAERDLAQANIAYAQSEAARLDTEIARIQRTLETLQQRRDTLLLFEEQERGLFAPIRKLPVVTDTFSWVQITDLELNGVWCAPDEICIVLENMPGLRYLDLKGPTGTTRSILTPNLEVLKLSEMEDNNILEILTAPCLKKLFIELGALFFSEQVVQFGKRSRFTLEVLKLYVMDIAPFSGIPEFASVKTLEWDDPLSFEDDIDLLITNDVFPRLETLCIRDLSSGCWQLEVDLPWTANKIVDLLKSRIRTSENEEIDKSARRHYLKKIHIYFDVEIAGADVKNIADFVQSRFVQDSGVEIYIAAAQGI